MPEDMISLENVAPKVLKSVLLFFTNGDFQYRSVNAKGLGAARNLDVKFLEAIANKYVKDKKSSTEKTRIRNIGGRIPKELVYGRINNMMDHMIVWIEKEGPRDLVWQNGKHNGTYYFPQMLMGIENAMLYILIYENKKFYVPNFPNVFSKGNMCHGSAKIKIDDNMTWQQIINAGRHAFFETYFSHPVKDTFFKEMKTKNSKPWLKEKPLSKSAIKSHNMASLV